MLSNSKHIFGHVIFAFSPFIPMLSCVHIVCTSQNFPPLFSMFMWHGRVYWIYCCLWRTRDWDFSLLCDRCMFTILIGKSGWRKLSRYSCMLHNAQTYLLKNPLLPCFMFLFCKSLCIQIVITIWPLPQPMQTDIPTEGLTERKA